jgi:hemerythrin
MNTHNGKDPFYVKALAEHRELSSLVKTIETRLRDALGTEAAREAAQRELPELFNRLWAYLRQHFAEEEAGGLLDEAISRLPRLGPQVTALERQHEPLLRELGQLLAKVQQCGCSEEKWQCIARELKAFTESLRTHEAAENRLAAEAFNGESAYDVPLASPSSS